MLASISKRHEIGGVIHFAGLKDVSESQSKPLRYYDNNVIDSITLIEESLKANIEYFVSLPLLKIYGNDYPTTNGTELRNYIHVEDLAKRYFDSESGYPIFV